MIKTIIFDIGGVITHSDFKAIYSGFAERIGIPPEFVIEYHKIHLDDLLLGNITLDGFWTDMRKAGGNPNLDYAKIWIEEGVKHRRVNKELLDIIGQLRKHYSVGTLTNLTPLRELIDLEMHLYSHFDFSAFSFREHVKKPDPAFYELALKRARTEPEEAIFIDDKEQCTIGAEAVGMKSILYVYPDNAKLLLDLKKLGISIR